MRKILQDLFELNQDAVLITVPDGRILKANPAAVELLGIKEKERQRHEHRKHLSLTDPPLRHFIEQAQHTSPVRQHFILNYLAGRQVDLDIRSTPFYLREGKQIYWTIIRTASSSKKEEPSISPDQNLQKLRSGIADTIINNTYYGIAALDRDLRYVEFNPAAERDTGIKRKNVIGRTFHEVFPDFVGSDLEKSIYKALNGKITIKEADPFFLPGIGLLKYYDTVISPICDADGEIFSALMVFYPATDRIKAQQQQNESEKRYRLLAENSTDVIITTDPEGNYLYVSPSIERMTGYTPEELLGLNTSEQIHPDDIPRVREYLRSANVESIIYRRKIKSGGYKWVEATGRGIPDEETGEITEFQYNVRDITQRMQMEQLLHNQRIFLDALLNSIEDSILGCDAEGNFTYYNKAALRTRPEGYAGTNINTSNYHERLYHPDGVTPLSREEFPLYRALRGETVENMHVIIKAGHKKLQFLITSKPLYDENGINLGAVAVSRNVTAEKEAREKLKKNQAILLKTHEIANIESFEMNLQTGELTFSPMFYKIWEFSPGEKITLEKILERTHPNDVQIKRNAIKTAVENLEPYNIEYRIILPDKSVRWLWAHGTVYKDRTGKPISLISTGLDITELKNIEEKLRQNNQQLQQTNDELEQLLFTLSHDLKEPLRMISVFNQLLISKCPEVSSEMKEYEAFIAEGLTRMQDMLNDLIVYENAVKYGDPLESVDSGQMLEKVLLHLKDEIEKSHAEILAHSLPIVRVRPNQLYQLFKILLSNSLKFRKIHVSPYIEISAEPDGGFWKFSIKDNGIGMDMDYHDKVFIFFQRLHTRDKYPGSGMGLPIAKKITENHGGKIWFNSVEGKGTTFYFTLPAVEENGK